MRGVDARERVDRQPFFRRAKQSDADPPVAQIEPRVCIRAEFIVGEDDLIAGPPVDAVRTEQRSVGR